MGKMMFGWDETITCIEPVGTTAENGDELCLAHKTSKLFVVAGVYVRDDGYVLGVPGQKGAYYPWPEEKVVKEWQAEGVLPTPLPSYSISAFDYAFGYSLWIIIAVMAAWAVLQRVRTKRRQARDALIPVSLGPPVVETEGDRFIDAELKKLLKDGEKVQHQALCLRDPEATIEVLFVGLTNLRLLLITGKRKFRGYEFQNLGVSEVLRSDIEDCTESSYELSLKLRSGGYVPLFVPIGAKEFSNQVVFARDVPRLLAATKAVGPAMQVLG
jgi:hypothetical protein